MSEKKSFDSLFSSLILTDGCFAGSFLQHTMVVDFLSCFMGGDTSPFHCLKLTLVDMVDPGTVVRIGLSYICDMLPSEIPGRAWETLGEEKNTQRHRGKARGTN